MHDLIETIATRATADRDKILASLRDYIAEGKSGEEAVQALFAKTAEDLGCTVSFHDYSPSDVELIEEFAGEAAIDPQPRRSVIAHFKGTGEGRSLIFFAHPDSEPVPAHTGWSRDPFAGEVVGGRMYGWGIADDLSGIAAGLQALDLLRSVGKASAGDIYIANTPSKRHARGVHRLLQEGMKADAAVYLHPAESGVGMREVKAFTSGEVDFRIVIEGKQPPTTEPLQTAFAHLGVNAIDKAWVILDALKKMDEERATRVKHPLLDAEVGRATNLMMSYIEAGNPKRLARLADRCTLGAAVAFPPPETLSAVCAEIEAAVAKAASEDEWLRDNPPKIIWDAGTTGAEVSRDHPLLAAAFAAVAGVSGTEPLVNPMHTGSDIRVPNVQKNIPTIGLGPLCGDLTQNGSHDEWVDADDHVRFVAAIAGIIAGWCGTTDI